MLFETTFTAQGQELSQDKLANPEIIEQFLMHTANILRVQAIYKINIDEKPPIAGMQFIIGTLDCIEGRVHLEAAASLNFLRLRVSLAMKGNQMGGNIKNEMNSFFACS